MPKRASCHRDLDKVKRSRIEARNGEGKGRAILLIEQQVRLVLAVMTVHVHGGKHLVAEMHLDPDSNDGLAYPTVVHLRSCARRLAAHPEMNDGDESFYLAIGRERKDSLVRNAAKTLGLAEVDPWLSQRVRFQDLYVYKPSQRVEVARSRARA